MGNKLSTLEQARHIVKTQNRVKSLEEHLQEYSYKGLDGKSWSINKIGDSRHFGAKRMIQLLPEDDQKAIDNYIVKKTRAAIRNGKIELKGMGVEYD